MAMRIYCTALGMNKEALVGADDAQFLYAFVHISRQKEAETW